MLLEELADLNIYKTNLYSIYLFFYNPKFVIITLCFVEFLGFFLFQAFVQFNLGQWL